MGSGFSGQSFCFHGYLPIDKVDRAKRIEHLAREVEKTGQTQVFIETPFRNDSLLEHLLQTLSHESLICIACELTSPLGFVQTKTSKQWAENLPSLHKKPCIFLLGK
jgi:16S rRNA (cytidine1402-2'-O)-methyltransferase